MALPLIPAAQFPATLDGRQALLRALLGERRVLVLLDNSRDPEQVRPLLPGAPGCLVIVTSRNELTGLIAADGARPIALDVLTEEDAHGMLARRLRDRVTAEPAAAARTDPLVRQAAAGSGHQALALNTELGNVPPPGTHPGQPWLRRAQTRQPSCRHRLLRARPEHFPGSRRPLLPT